MHNRAISWTPLRIFVIAAGVFGAAFWIGSVVRWWTIPAAKRDGFELMGVALATIYFLVLVLPPLILGALGRWLGLAAVFGALAIILGTDTLVPWVPWSLLPGPR